MCYETYSKVSVSFMFQHQIISPADAKHKHIAKIRKIQQFSTRSLAGHMHSWRPVWTFCTTTRWSAKSAYQRFQRNSRKLVARQALRFRLAVVMISHHVPVENSTLRASHRILWIRCVKKKICVSNVKHSRRWQITLTVHVSKLYIDATAPPVKCIHLCVAQWLGRSTITRYRRII